MSLTAAQLEARDGRLTASRVGVLMSGDAAAIHRLWQELIGDPAYIEEDLSGVWAVQLGSHTESLNLDWYARKAPVSRRGEVVLRSGFEWAACTLDGWDETIPGAIECKHVGGREPLSRIIERYQPQLHWQMLVTGTTAAALSVIEGANEPVIERIELDGAYASELWDRAERFMRCVWSLTPPVALAPVAAPVRAEKTYDMTGSNEWASAAADWLANRDGKRVADAAEKSLKALVPADAARCHGHGATISRNRAGSLSLRAIEGVK